jgi:ferredoxin-type protein NapF
MATEASRRGFLRRLGGRPARRSCAEIGRRCLAFGGVFCQACADACEPRAIRFVPLRGRAPTPVVADESCTACGACLAVCPAGAIVLERPADA